MTLSLDELRAQSLALDAEDAAAALVLREAEERATLEAEIKAKQARIAAGKIAPFWARFQPIAEAKRWRLGRLPVYVGGVYAEIFYRHASETEIKAKPDTEEEARQWLLDKVIWYPPAGEGEIDKKALRIWIDGIMIDFPATWARLAGDQMALSLETAEIVRGKA